MNGNSRPEAAAKTPATASETTVSRPPDSSAGTTLDVELPFDVEDEPTKPQCVDNGEVVTNDFMAPSPTAFAQRPDGHLGAARRDAGVAQAIRNEDRPWRSCFD